MDRAILMVMKNAGGRRAETESKSKTLANASQLGGVVAEEVYSCPLFIHGVTTQPLS